MAASFGGRVAFVTGGASGIGRACAEQLAAAGARVAVADLRVEQAREVAGALARARAVGLDLTDPVSVIRAVEETTREMGDIDVLVNCAGGDEVKPFLETDEALWDRMIQLNLYGVFRTVHGILPGMVERKRGSIVNIGSDAGRVGSSGEGVYSGAKGGVIAFTKTIAREVARAGVRSNCVCPGPTDTPQLRGNVAAGGEAFVEALTRAIPLRRLGKADEVAAAVVFLASDEASFITGQTLSVSGGLTMV
jgi:2-hydroxycyclohexanecarboxyl-CoA dehydrogenase